MQQAPKAPLRRQLLTAGAGLAAVVGTAMGSAPARAAAPPSQAEALEQLLSKQAISEVLYRYPRGLDLLDRDILLSLGHANGTVQFGKMRFDPWASFVDWLLEAHKSMLSNNHRMTNMLIEVRGDKAVSETTGTATLVVAVEKDQIEERWMHSRYLDRWSRRNGRWAIDSRQSVTDFRRIEVFPASELKTRYSTLGDRLGKDDPSYKLFNFQ